MANTTPFPLPGQHLTSLFPVFSITSINFALIIEAQGSGLVQEGLRPSWRGTQAHSRVRHCPMVSLHDFKFLPLPSPQFPLLYNEGFGPALHFQTHRLGSWVPLQTP